MQKLVKTGKTQKSTNNPMSSFGSIEDNIELPRIHLAVFVLWNIVKSHALNKIDL